MTLENVTNRTIPLSLEPLVDVQDWSGLPGWDGYSVPTGTDTSGAPWVQEPASLTVDADYESSSVPPHSVLLAFFTDDEPWYRLTYEEAEMLYERLGLILGRNND